MLRNHQLESIFKERKEAKEGTIKHLPVHSKSWIKQVKAGANEDETLIASDINARGRSAISRDLNCA